MYHMHARIQRSQKKGADSLELGLQITVRSLWMLRAEPGSLARAASNPSYCCDWHNDQLGKIGLVLAGFLQGILKREPEAGTCSWVAPPTVCWAIPPQSLIKKMFPHACLQASLMGALLSRNSLFSEKTHQRRL